MPVIGGDAISGGYVYQGERHPELKNKLIFGDMTTGNIWYSDMDELLAADDNDTNNLANKYSLASDLKMLTEQTYKKRGGTQLPLPGQGVVSGKGRIDLRFGQDSSGEIFIMTKSDGMIRQISEIKTTVKNP